MRKKLLIHLLTLVAFCYSTSFAQTKEEVTSLIFHLDSAFWKAYNDCDTAGFKKFLSEDVEFYHDKGGVTKGAHELTASFAKNLCGKQNYRLRREAMPNTVEVFPLAKDNEYYGATISGEHLFYVNENNKPEYLDGQATFMQLWLKENGDWKMKRILSYNHHAPEYKNERKKVQVSAGDLSKLTGRYGSKKFGLMEVVIAEDHLLLNAGKQKFALLPQSALSYFTAERDIVFDFLLEGQNKAQKIIVMENGKLEDTLIRED